jgi:hypothetical protein
MNAQRAVRRPCSATQTASSEAGEQIGVAESETDGGAGDVEGDTAGTNRDGARNAACAWPDAMYPAGRAGRL